MAHRRMRLDTSEATDATARNAKDPAVRSPRPHREVAQMWHTPAAGVWGEWQVTSTESPVHRSPAAPLPGRPASTRRLITPGPADGESAAQPIWLALGDQQLWRSPDEDL